MAGGGRGPSFLGAAGSARAPFVSALPSELGIGERSAAAERTRLSHPERPVHPARPEPQGAWRPSGNPQPGDPSLRVPRAAGKGPPRKPLPERAPPPVSTSAVIGGALGSLLVPGPAVTHDLLAAVAFPSVNMAAASRSL